MRVEMEGRGSQGGSEVCGGSWRVEGAKGEAKCANDELVFGILFTENSALKCACTVST